MTNLKKKNDLAKIEQFINANPILLILQSPNSTANEWFSFKQHMKENNVEFQLLHVKNSLLKQYLMKNQKLSHLNSVETLCQGPNFLLGCKEVDNVKKLWDFLHTPSFLIKKTEMPSFLFMGCFIKIKS